MCRFGAIRRWPLLYGYRFNMTIEACVRQSHDLVVAASFHREVALSVIASRDSRPIGARGYGLTIKLDTGDRAVCPLLELPQSEPDLHGRDQARAVRCFERDGHLTSPAAPLRHRVGRQDHRRPRKCVCQRLADRSIRVLEILVDTSYRSKKAELLGEANRQIEVLRWLVRLAKDRQLLSVWQYGFACKGLTECGRMIGGWLKEEAAARAEASAGPQ